VKKSKLFGLLGLEKILESLQNLIEVRIAIVKDEVEAKVAEKLTKILPMLLVMLAFNLLILFASLTLSFYLSDLLGSYMYGFGIVTLGYLLLTIIFYLLKDSKALKNAVSKSISKQNKEE
jgi:F0F1-type ATP synthase membrane subunit a